MKTKVKLLAAFLVALMVMFIGATVYAQDPTPTPTPDWVELLRETVIPGIREAQDALATPTPPPPPPTATPVPPVPTQLPPAGGPVEREKPQGPQAPQVPQAPAQPQQTARPERPGIADRIFGGIAGFLGRKVVDPVGNFITRFKWILIAIGVLIVIGILSYVFRGIQWLLWVISQLRYVWTLLRWLAAGAVALVRFISEIRARRPEPRRPDEYELTAPPPPLAATEVIHPDEGDDLDVPGWRSPRRRPRTGVIDENDLPTGLRRGTPLENIEEREEDQDPPGWFSRAQKELWWRLVRLGWLDSTSYSELVEYVKSQTQIPDEPAPRRGVTELLNFLRTGEEEEQGADDDRVQKLIDFLQKR